MVGALEFAVLPKENGRVGLGLNIPIPPPPPSTSRTLVVVLCSLFFLHTVPAFKGDDG